MKAVNWACTRCGALLGIVRGERLHVQFSRGHQYYVAFPATSICRRCGTLNELPSTEAAVRR